MQAAIIPEEKWTLEIDMKKQAQSSLSLDKVLLSLDQVVRLDIGFVNYFYGFWIQKSHHKIVECFWKMLKKRHFWTPRPKNYFLIFINVLVKTKFYCDKIINKLRLKLCQAQVQLN